MRYLIVSGSLRDAGGLAMIKGAMNGIKYLDKKAKFRSLHRKIHHKKGACKTYTEPAQNEKAFKWADIILDIGGLCVGQRNKYNWLKLRKELDKPYVWMSQSFQFIDKELLEGTIIVCREKRSAQLVKNAGFKCEVAPDLSFLVEPQKWTGKKCKRVFSTHFPKNIAQMYNICNKNTDVQVIEKPGYRRTGELWEPRLPIDSFIGSVEENFGLIETVDEVHTARYQIACAAISAGIKPVLYTTGDKKYNEKYSDLMDFYGNTKKQLREAAMISCQAAVNAGEQNYGVKKSIRDKKKLPKIS